MVLLLNNRAKPHRLASDLVQSGHSLGRRDYKLPSMIDLDPARWATVPCGGNKLFAVVRTLRNEVFLHWHGLC